METNNNGKKKAQIVYFSHGGGPLPLLGDSGHDQMVAFMRRLPQQLHQPEAILVISAHWEESTATLLGSAHPAMFYDYYGFPPETYTVQYPAPGAPALASRIAACLHQAGIQAHIDEDRGFDHGVFIPLMLMYPQAHIPTLQLSLLAGLDPVAHIVLGKALRPLLEENILVIGSGFSFHNLGAFDWEETAHRDAPNDAFQDWLLQTVSGALPEEERQMLLVDWEKAPSARYCHPRSDHLLPLHVCQGMAGEAGQVIFDDRILGKRCLGFQWQVR